MENEFGVALVGLLQEGSVTSQALEEMLLPSLSSSESIGDNVTTTTLPIVE